MKKRPYQKTEFFYNVVPQRAPQIIAFLPPAEFQANIINFIRECPKDILQLINPLGYFEIARKNLYQKGYELNFIYDTDILTIIDFWNSLPQIELYFMDSDSKLFDQNLNKLISKKETLRFYYIYGNNGTDVEIPNRVYSPLDFLIKIVENQDSILKQLGISGQLINPSNVINRNSFYNYHYFAPTKSNFWTIINITGNFGYESSLSKDEERKILDEETKKAHQSVNSFERQNLIPPQIERIDFFDKMLLGEKLIERVTGTEPIYSPLIIVAPSHNPDVKKILHEESIKDIKKILAVLFLEQTENYINLVENDKLENVAFGLKFLSEKTSFLDNIAYLHASFTSSPIIRLPILGKSIYRESSFFKTTTFPNLAKTKTRNKIKKTLSNEMVSLIKGRNGQIIAISDLPIEWLTIDDIPIAFTHDICRLPETSLNGLVALYTKNNIIEYSIPTDIIDKTLVITGSQDASFAIWHKQLEELNQTLKFKIVHCKTIGEVIDSVVKYKPELLIFDCHGEFDSDNSSTHLLIGNEKLTNEVIVKNNIFAPLIFISACGTAPLYGLINTVANGFFEAGALSVTATYLPIEINSGSILYIRLLNKLDYAAKNGIHKNWLEFISHIIRTSSIMDAYSHVFKKSKNFSKKEWQESNIKTLTESLFFENRRNLYNNLDNHISKLDKNLRDSFTKRVPEYLFYSNLGRSDLIIFDKYKEKHNNMLSDIRKN
jgi:hypothetical protein